MCIRDSVASRQPAFPGDGRDRGIARHARLLPDGDFGRGIRGRAHHRPGRSALDHQGNLAEHAGAGPFGQLGQGAAADFLVRLGQLAACLLYTSRCV